MCYIQTMRFLGGLVLAFALTACSAPADPASVDAPLVVDPTHAHWTISSEFAPEEVDGILTAAQAWHDETNGRVELTFEIADTSLAPWAIIRGAGDPGYGGITNDARDSVELYPDAGRDPRCNRLFAAHELGHTFGLDHGGEGIMHDKHTRTCTRDFTADDVAMFDAL